MRAARKRQSTPSQSDPVQQLVAIDADDENIYATFTYNTNIFHVLLPKHVLELIKAGTQHTGAVSSLESGRKNTTQLKESQRMKKAHTHRNPRVDLHELQIEAIRNHLVAKAYIHSEERALILKEIISSASKRLFFPPDFHHCQNSAQAFCWASDSASCHLM